MAGKLDQSLDEILSSNRAGGRARRSQRHNGVRKSATSAGIQKSTKPARASKPVSAPAPKPSNGESKIMISNLPKDVAEGMIKEYFQMAIGPVKKTDISYGPNGQSRGQAFVTFVRADGAVKAFQKLNGLLVDNRPIKIDIIVGNADAEKIIPAVTPKPLSARVSKPKSQPKPQQRPISSRQNTTQKSKKSNGPRKPRSAKPAKKTKEELDAEMIDYFEAAPAETAAPTDAIMDDGIL